MPWLISFSLDLMVRAMVIMLIVLAMLGFFSAITGIRSVHTDPGVGTVVTYHHGFTRLYAAGLAAVCVALVYAIYRRHIIAWWIGLIGWIAGAAQMIFIIWRDTYSGPQMGLYSALAASAGLIAVGSYWCYRWYGQKSYFT
jgi:hypothetical protein